MHHFDTRLETFSDDVLQASKTAPVLVDFWAPWCGPCKSLMPVLMNLADEYAGAFKLAKVNIDEQQQLAQQFGVRSVPTVKLVKNGKIVDEFVGAQSAETIRAMLDKHVVKESDVNMQAALQRYQQGDKQAIADMIAIINANPANNNIRMQYVDVLLQEKQFDDAKMILKALPENLRNKPEVAGLLSRLEFMGQSDIEANGDANSLLAAIEKDPNDCESRYQLGTIYIRQANYEAALEQFLEIMRRDRKFNDDAGRTGILKVFEMLGGSGPLVSRYRQKMASLLY